MDAADQLDRDVRRSRHRDPEARQIVGVTARVVEDRLVQGGRSRQHRDTLGGHAREHAIHVEHRLRKHRRPAGDGGQDPGLETEHVEVGIDHQVDVPGREPGHGDPVRRDAEGPPVRHHDALGDPGRPGREEDVGRIVRPERGGAAIDLGQRLRRGAGEEALPIGGTPGGAPSRHDNRIEVGQLHPRGVEHGEVVVTQEAGDGHQDAGPAPQQQIGRLGTLEPGVDGNQHPARGEDPERGNDPLDAVGRPDRHPFTRHQAGGGQSGGEVAAGLAELRVRETRGAVTNGDSVSVPLGGGRNRLRNGRRCAALGPHRETAAGTPRRP